MCDVACYGVTASLLCVTVLPIMSHCCYVRGLVLCVSVRLPHCVLLLVCMCDCGVYRYWALSVALPNCLCLLYVLLALFVCECVRRACVRLRCMFTFGVSRELCVCLRANTVDMSSTSVAMMWSCVGRCAFVLYVNVQ